MKYLYSIKNQLIEILSYFSYNSFYFYLEPYLIGAEKWDDKSYPFKNNGKYLFLFLKL